MRKAIGVLMVLLLLVSGCGWVRETPEPTCGVLAHAHDPESVIVRYRSAPQSVPAGMRQIGPDQLNLYVAEVADVAGALEVYCNDPNVLYSEPNYIYEAVDTVPNDPHWGSLWGMRSIRAPGAWDLAVRGVPVVGIDTGVYYDHPDLNPWTNAVELNGRPGVDDDGNGWVDDVYGIDTCNRDSDPYDDNGHGTHTAGTVGAVGNNGVGVVGVAWGPEVGACKFLASGGRGYISDAVDCLVWAVDKGFRVSNNSWGGTAFSQALYDIIGWAGRVNGHVFVTAAGNINRDLDEQPLYPAAMDLPNIISVTAIDQYDRLASFAAWGKVTVDLGAPGVSVLSTLPGGGYGRMDGTSMASPHVAGAVAMVRYLRPDWSAERVKNHLLTHVRPIDALRGKTVSGGVLDLDAAIASLGPQPTPTPTLPSPLPTPTTEPTETPPLPTPEPMTTATVRVQSVTVAPGNIFYTTVDVKDLWKASGYQMIVDYDTDVVEPVLEAFEWGPMFDSDPTIELGPDVRRGYLAFGRLDFSLADYRGDGELAYVAWRALQEGDAALHFRVEGEPPPTSYFMTSRGERPPAEYVDGVITVRLPTPTPTATPVPTNTPVPTQTPTPAPTQTPSPPGTGWAVVVRGFESRAEAEAWAERIRGAEVVPW